MSVPNFILKILLQLLHGCVSCLLFPLLHGLVSCPLLPLLQGLVTVYFTLSPTQSCGMGTTGSPASPQHISNSPVLSGIHWISVQNILNSETCRGFVQVISKNLVHWEMFQSYVPNRNTILDQKILHPNVFFVLGDRLAPIFLQ